MERGFELEDLYERGGEATVCGGRDSSPMLTRGRGRELSPQREPDDDDDEGEEEIEARDRRRIK